MSISTGERSESRADRVGGLERTRSAPFAANAAGRRNERRHGRHELRRRRSRTRHHERTSLEQRAITLDARRRVARQRAQCAALGEPALERRGALHRDARRRLVGLVELLRFGRTLVDSKARNSRLIDSGLDAATAYAHRSTRCCSIFNPNRKPLHNERDSQSILTKRMCGGASRIDESLSSQTTSLPRLLSQRYTTPNVIGNNDESQRLHYQAQQNSWPMRATTCRRRPTPTTPPTL